MKELNKLNDVVDSISTSIPTPKPLGKVIERKMGKNGMLYVLECGHQYSEAFDGRKEIGQETKCTICEWWQEDDAAGRRRYGTSGKGV